MGYAVYYSRNRWLTTDHYPQQQQQQHRSQQPTEEMLQRCKETALISYEPPTGNTTTVSRHIHPSIHSFICPSASVPIRSGFQSFCLSIHQSVSPRSFKAYVFRPGSIKVPAPNNINLAHVYIYIYIYIYIYTHTHTHVYVKMVDKITNRLLDVTFYRSQWWAIDERRPCRRRRPLHPEKAGLTRNPISGCRPKSTG